MVVIIDMVISEEDVEETTVKENLIRVVIQTQID